MLVSDVDCTGTEQKLHLCSFTGRSTHICDRNNSAGVICSRDFGKYHTLPGSFIERYISDTQQYRYSQEMC